MYFISLTRLRIRSIIFLPKFLLANEASIKFIKRVEGFIKGKELIDRKLTFWTITVWESDPAMKYFRNNDPHKSAMRKLPDWCDEGAYAHWLQEEDTIPEWDVLYQKLRTIGKITKVRNPSPDHAGMDHPEIKWKKIERLFINKPGR